MAGSAAPLKSRWSAGAVRARRPEPRAERSMAPGGLACLKTLDCASGIRAYRSDNLTASAVLDARIIPKYCRSEAYSQPRRRLHVRCCDDHAACVQLDRAFGWCRIAADHLIGAVCYCIAQPLVIALAVKWLDDALSVWYRATFSDLWIAEGDSIRSVVALPVPPAQNCVFDRTQPATLKPGQAATASRWTAELLTTRGLS